MVESLKDTDEGDQPFFEEAVKVKINEVPQVIERILQVHPSSLNLITAKENEKEELGFVSSETDASVSYQDIICYGTSTDRS